MSGRLEPIEPRNAVEMYLEKREPEVAESTYYSQKTRLTKFANWCDREGIENLNNLTGRLLHQYVIHLQRYFTEGDADPSPMTVQTRLSTVRVFLRFCEDIDAVPEGMSDKVSLPDIDPEDRRRNAYLHSDDADHILKQLRKRYYGSREHALFRLAWRTAARIGTLRGLDVGDLDGDENRLTVQHRPETDTPLKNKQRGERVIALTDDTVDVLTEYIEYHRQPVTDEYGREPLFTTENGRPAKTTLRGTLYRAQLPCFHSNDCPHGQGIVECDYNTDKQRHNCPSTVKPHSIRRGGVTKFLSDGIPETAVGDRADMTQDVLSEHYDARSPTEKAEVRRQHFGDE
ncbi:tyrosine-type recombinase/integrase [Halovenus sp. WSH3]|uniref:Tyrosine-type recombinase/integrase n=1 Tax=Halovenus carboxidivorans TaxID=2692199 RepID=A0A6B0T5R0_9EURY|nr:site-specific integrase [Halovenus carboxidivorans]MXR50662.1 tyrosine-type recombinase/integrase [Halovenus carboxidivorans]